MRYAETGFRLEVDLSTGSISRVPTDPNWTELFLGGQGTAAKLLWDRVGPEVQPFDPENLLIFTAGLLVGTPVPGANRTVVNTISPQTGLFAHSVFGAFFGPELKQAGYDQIVFKGQAPEWVYLWIHNDKVELRDARHLLGKGPQTVTEILREELGQPEAQVAAIGLAGENRVYLATLESASGSASRGVGAVMGSKRLKAIAVRGTRDIQVAHPEEMFGLSLDMFKAIGDNPYTGDIMAHEDDEEFHVDNFAWGNARKRIKGFWNKEREERWKKISESYRLRWTGCYNCPKDCHQALKVPGKPTFFQKCYSKLTYSMAAFKEIDFNYQILALTQDYGLDGFSTPQVLAFAVELYENGILTDEDLPGFPEDNGDRFFYLVEKIVRREGVGDALANGVYHAARQIGRGAEKFDHNTMKKFEQVPIKLKMINFPYFLMYATGEKMNITQIEGSFPQVPIADKKEREEFVRGWEAAPERFKKWYLEWEPRTHLPLEAAVHICDWNETMHYIDDAIGMCAFLSSFRGQFGGRPPYHIYNLPTFIRAASGIELTPRELWNLARRNRNLVRAINVRRGLRRKDERPPEDHWQIRDPEKEQKVLSDYYTFKGWTQEGIPTVGTLEKLGLPEVAQDLVRRGILKEDDREPVFQDITA